MAQIADTAQRPAEQFLKKVLALVEKVGIEERKATLSMEKAAPFSHTAETYAHQANA